MRKIRSTAIRLGTIVPVFCLVDLFTHSQGILGCLNTFTKWKIASGKWKVSTVIVIPCSTRNLLMLIKEKLSELTLNQVQGARNHFPLQGRGQGEGSSRRGKPCKNFPLSTFNYQLLFKHGGLPC